MIHKSFECYKELMNEEIKNRELKINKSLVSGLDEIVRVYEIFLKNTDYLKEIKEIVYTIKNIEDFCHELKKYQNEKNFYCTGFYISKLINNIIKNDEEIILDLTELEKEITDIGRGLKRGRVVIKGYAGEHIGNSMEGGDIVIYGNVGHRLGRNMKGGEITINGYTDDFVGIFMTGGKIYLNGKYESISGLIEGGEIYHKGKLIWPK